MNYEQKCNILKNRLFICFYDSCVFLRIFNRFYNFYCFTLLKILINSLQSQLFRDNKPENSLKTISSSAFLFTQTKISEKFYDFIAIRFLCFIIVLQCFLCITEIVLSNIMMRNKVRKIFCIIQKTFKNMEQYDARNWIIKLSEHCCEIAPYDQCNKCFVLSD